MRSIAFASEPEDDEVIVSSIEVLEANVVAIRSDLNELKNDFRAAIARIDNDIKSAVIRLQEEIRAFAAKAERDLQQVASRLEAQLAEMRAEDRSLRERVDKNFETLCTKIDATNEKVVELDRKVTSISSRMNALIWVIGGLGTLIIIAISVAGAFNWLKPAR